MKFEFLRSKSAKSREKIFKSMKSPPESMMLVFTMLTTLAEAFASPVTIKAVEEASWVSRTSGVEVASGGGISSVIISGVVVASSRGRPSSAKATEGKTLKKEMLKISQKEKEPRKNPLQKTFFIFIVFIIFI